MASASGYQMVVSVGEAKQIKDMAITSLQVLIMSAFRMCWTVEQCLVLNETPGPVLGEWFLFNLVLEVVFHQSVSHIFRNFVIYP